MVTFTDLEASDDARAEADEEVPPDVWDRLWEEWEPFGSDHAD